MRKNILLTGGAGFIGANLCEHLAQNKNFEKIIILDNLTYAGDISNIPLLEYDNLKFIEGDIRDNKIVENILITEKIDTILNLAAESHVDNSILDPSAFVSTNVNGTINLLNCAREVWKKDLKDKLFYQISTDEVYGSISHGEFDELSNYNPLSPYSASKASADHFVRAYYNTYGLPTLVSNCSNNYGPKQHQEKLIPLMIHNIKNRLKLPIYGNGKNIRDWLYVKDHCRAIELLMLHGTIGETYCIGGGKELENIAIVNQLISIIDKKLGRGDGESKSLIHFVKDRPGHDFRYAINYNKLQQQLNWRPVQKFNEGIEITVDWYLRNKF